MAMAILVMVNILGPGAMASKQVLMVGVGKLVADWRRRCRDRRDRNRGQALEEDSLGLRLDLRVHPYPQGLSSLRLIRLFLGLHRRPISLLLILVQAS